jgi:hypothetical protein
VCRSSDRLKAYNEARSKVVVWNLALLCHVSPSVDHLSPAPSTKGEKRPADAIGNAVVIAKIATGEIEDITT